ncbi:MAG: tetratricopeptide repeat protein, partial [Bdellovibrio sp.]
LYASLKNPTKAILEFQEALRLDPKHEEAHLYLGAVYAENNQPELAVKIFEKLSKLESYQNTHLAFHYIGRVRAEQGTKISRRQAEEAFKKALSLKPDHLESNLALGALWREQKKDVQALNIFEKFQKEYGPSLRMAEVLTEIYLQAEKFDLALDQLMILEKNSDETLNAKLRIAMILIQKKNYKEAISRLQEIIQQVPESDKIRFYLAAVLEETGEFSRALEHFKRIPPESQFFGESIVHAAYILKKEKKFEEAIRLLEPAVKARPELPQLIAVLASLLDDRDDLPRAQRILAEGLKKFPENTQLWFFNGSVQDRLGKKEESLQSMQKVVDLDPNHIQGLNYLAYTLADLGRDLSKAENLVKRALAMEPHDGFILDTYGWIKFKQGRFSEAVKTLERAFQLQPDEAIIAQHLGDAYQKVRVFQKAQAMYRRAIELEADPKKKSAIEIKSLALEKQIGLERSAASSP